MGHTAKSGSTAKDRTKHEPTRRRNGLRRTHGERPLGIVGFVLGVALGLFLLYAAVGGVPDGVDLVGRSSGHAGALGRMQVDSCTKHGSNRSVTYSCLGKVTPPSAVGWSSDRLDYLRGASGREAGKDMAVDCTPADDCTAVGVRPTLNSLLVLYFFLGLGVAGAALLAASVLGRWPGRFGRLRGQVKRPGLYALGALVAAAVIAASSVPLWVSV